MPPYNPYMSYQNPYMSYQQPAQQYQSQQSGSGVYWCHGQSDAERWAVAPGNAVAIMDIDAPVLYLRSCDNTGKPSTTVYDLVERSAIPKPTPGTEYLTRDEFEKFKAEYIKSKEESINA